jgi:hypothetical protein
MALTTSGRIFVQTSRALVMAFLERDDPDRFNADGNAASDIESPTLILIGVRKTKKPPEWAAFRI